MFSCKKENMGDCFMKTGIIVKETREIESFDSISIGRRLEVTLVEDTVDFVIVEAGDNLQEKITTVVENGLLTIESTSQCNWVRSYKEPINIEIHFSNLRHVEVNGSSNISVPDTIHQAELVFEFWNSAGDLNLLIDNNKLEIIQHTGPSDVQVKGFTDELVVYMASLSSGDYDELFTPKVYVQTLSSANCRVFATETFFFRVNGDGGIFYKGSGEVIYFEKTGRGNIAPIL